MILAVMNAIYAIAYRSLKNSGLQWGLNSWPYNRLAFPVQTQEFPMLSIIEWLHVKGVWYQSFFCYFAYLLPFVWAHSCISLPAMLDPRQDIASSSIVHMLAPFCPKTKLILVITNKALISNGSMEENITWIDICTAIIISRLLRIIRVELFLK